MYQSINIHDFRNAFQAYDRQDNFSYEGQQLLFDWLEEYEDYTGEIMELDVVALCCDFTESDLEDINQDYSQSFETLEDAVEWLEYRTSVVGITDSTIVFQAF